MTDKPLLTEKINKLLKQVISYYASEMIKLEFSLEYTYGETTYFNDQQKVLRRKTLIKATQILKSLPWDEQIVFCLYSPYSDNLINHLDDEQQVAVKLMK